MWQRIDGLIVQVCPRMDDLSRVECYGNLFSNVETFRFILCNILVFVQFREEHIGLQNLVHFAEDPVWVLRFIHRTGIPAYSIQGAGK